MCNTLDFNLAEVEVEFMKRMFAAEECQNKSDYSFVGYDINNSPVLFTNQIRDKMKTIPEFIAMNKEILSQLEVTPKAGETWWVCISGAKPLCQKKIHKISDKTVSIYTYEQYYNNERKAVTYKRSDIEFVEKV